MDNVARGFVLKSTHVMDAEQLVLVTQSDKLADRFRDGQMAPYRRILYLPMDQTVALGKPEVLATAQAAGRKATELPVVHPGMFEAILLEADAADQETPSEQSP